MNLQENSQKEIDSEFLEDHDLTSEATEVDAAVLPFLGEESVSAAEGKQYQEENYLGLAGDLKKNQDKRNHISFQSQDQCSCMEMDDEEECNSFQEHQLDGQDQVVEKKSHIDDR